MVFELVRDSWYVNIDLLDKCARCMLTAFVVEIDGEIQLRGTGSPAAFRSAEISDLRQVFGDFTGPKGFLTTCGNVWWFQRDEDEGGRVCDGYEMRPIQEDGDLQHIAVAGNGQASFVHGNDLCSTCNLRILLKTDR